MKLAKKYLTLSLIGMSVLSLNACSSGKKSKASVTSAVVSSTLSDAEHCLNFVSSVDGTVYQTEMKKEGEDILVPSDPSMDGYEFRGWYSDTECTTSFNVTKMPSSNLTVYAKFVHLFEYAESDSVRTIEKSKKALYYKTTSSCPGAFVFYLYSDTLTTEECVEKIEIYTDEDLKTRVKSFSDFDYDSVSDCYCTKEADGNLPAGTYYSVISAKDNTEDKNLCIGYNEIHSYDYKGQCINDGCTAVSENIITINANAEGKEIVIPSESNSILKIIPEGDAESYIFTFKVTYTSDYSFAKNVTVDGYDGNLNYTIRTNIGNVITDGQIKTTLKRGAGTFYIDLRNNSESDVTIKADITTAMVE